MDQRIPAPTMSFVTTAPHELEPAPTSMAERAYAVIRTS